MASSSSSIPRICEVCSRINFAAILTPRAFNEQKRAWEAIYRPQYDVDHKSHNKVGRQSKRSSKSTAKNCIPSASYDDLSASSENEWNEHPETDLNAWPHISSVEDSTVEPPSSPNSPNSTQTKKRFSRIWRRKEKKTEEEGTPGRSGRWEDQSESDSENDFTVMGSDRIDPESDPGRYLRGHSFRLGSIWDVRSRRHTCDICWYIWQQARRNPDVKSRVMVQSRCIMKLAELRGKPADDDDKREVIIWNLVVLYGYKLALGSEWDVHEAFILQGTHRDVCNMPPESQGDPVLQLDDRLWGEGRWLNEQCNYDLFRKWLHLCETKHHHERKAGSGELAFRLIDVNQRCIVGWRGLTSQVPRFIALSYVWGEQSRKFTLDSACVAHSGKPGFLDRPLDQTVRDAMEVVSRIGERYLWVDAFCIIQDSRDDKDRQIPQMQNIYGSAILTIVAMCGENSDAGLPGVRPRSRQGCAFAVNLQDVRISPRSFKGVRHYMEYTEFDENYLEGCPWQERGWTFQEAYLSTRALVFAQVQTFWECPKCTWCEETHWESDKVDFISWRGVMDPTPDDVWKEKMMRKARDMNNAFQSEQEPARNSYAAVIKEFTKRSLKNQGDVLDACNGVLASIKGRDNTGFLFGLRERHFGNDLLFNLLDLKARRFGPREPSEVGIPSWSWAFWKGPTEITNEPRNNSYDLVMNLAPCDGVKCHVLQLDRMGGPYLRVINNSGGWRFHEGYVRQGEGIYNPTNSARQPSEGGDKAVMEAHQPLITYPQDIELAELLSHPAFHNIKPSFHIIFRTFASPVYLRREYDSFTAAMSQVIMGGTHTLRGHGEWRSREPEHQKLYALEQHGDNFVLGAYLGFLAQKKKPVQRMVQIGTTEYYTSGFEMQYESTIADGFYVLLWMNNNQLPMFGHLLCTPALSQGRVVHNWDQYILHRVAGIVGPTDILETQKQKKYAARWGTWILT